MESEIRYKMMVRSYRICHAEMLRDAVQLNRVRYEKYMRKRKKSYEHDKRGSGN